MKLIEGTEGLTNNFPAIAAIAVGLLMIVFANPIGRFLGV